MNYSIGLHNEAWQVTAALLAMILGSWAAVRLYGSRGSGAAVLLLSTLALSGVLSLPMVLWGRPDGACGTVWGLPLTIRRDQTGCVDVTDSTGLSIPLVGVNLLVAASLAHALVLAVRQFSRTTSRPQ